MIQEIGDLNYENKWISENIAYFVIEFHSSLFEIVSKYLNTKMKIPQQNTPNFQTFI